MTTLTKIFSIAISAIGLFTSYQQMKSSHLSDVLGFIGNIFSAFA